MSEVLKNLGDSLDGEKSQLALIDLSENKDLYTSVSYTHLTLPTNREV